MHLRAAQFLRIDYLSDSCFDQRRTCQIQTASLRHQNFVAENRQVSAARDAITHDGSKLRDASRRNDGVVAKDAAEIIFVRKDLILHWQEDASRIDQVNNRQGTFKRDALGPKYFFGCLWKEGPSLHCRVVGDNHARNACDVADARDRASRRDFPPLFVHFVSRPETDLEKLRVFVQQMIDPFAHWQTAHFPLTLVAGFASAFPQCGFLLGNCSAVSAQQFTAGR